MDETVITWSAENIVTISLMVLLLFFVAGFAMKTIVKMKAKSDA